MTGGSKLKNKNKKGFTLVELIVVVCIFGIIMGAILNMIKPTQQIYNDTDATMETNLKGSGLANYLDDHLRYSTNILVLKDYCGVPNVSATGTLGSDTTPYDSCIVIDNNNLRGYSLTNYSGDDTDTAQKRMGATGCLIDVSQITSGGFNFNNSKVAMGVDYYDVYKYDITAGINTIDDMYTLDFSIDAYQPDYSNGSYTYVKTKFSKEASVNLTNINIDKGDTYKMRGFIDFSTAADYTTYPRATAPTDATAQQSVYYDTTNADNTYTYIFYNKNSTGSGTQYEVQYVYAASDPDPNYAGKSVGSPVNVKKGALLKNAPTLAPRNGYANPYWLDEDGKTVDFTAGVVINRSQVFTAVYPPVSPVPTHIVTFKNLDGTVFKENACSEGGPATAPGTPKDFDTKKQDWIGWNTKSDGTGDTPDKVTVTDDKLVFYPIVKNKHKVEFEVEGTIDTANTTYVSDGGTASYPSSTPPTSSDSNKSFSRWVKKGTSDDISTVQITGDTVFEAEFVTKPSITADPNAIITVIDYDNSNTCKAMFIKGYNTTTSVYVEGNNTPIFTGTNFQNWIDISAYVGTDTRFIIKSSFCYSNIQNYAEYQIQFCDTIGSWTWVKTGLLKAIDSSCLGQVYYVKV